MIYLAICSGIIPAAVIFFLVRRIRELEAAVRKHRDQRGDDRCWLDDYDLYSVLRDNLVEADLRLPPREEFLANCRRFHFCRSVAENPGDAVALYRSMPRDGR